MWTKSHPQLEASSALQQLTSLPLVEKQLIWLALHFHYKQKKLSFLCHFCLLETRRREKCDVNVLYDFYSRRQHIWWNGNDMQVTAVPCAWYVGAYDFSIPSSASWVTKMLFAIRKQLSLHPEVVESGSRQLVREKMLTMHKPLCQHKIKQSV